MVIFVVVVIAGELHDPSGAGRPLRGGGRRLAAGLGFDASLGIGGRLRLRPRRGRFALCGRLDLVGAVRLRPLLLHAGEPRGEIGEILAVDRGEVQLVAVCGVFRHLARGIARQEGLHGAEHVERLKATVFHHEQRPLLLERCVALLLRLVDRRDRRLRLRLHAVGPGERAGVVARGERRPREIHAHEADRRRAQKPHAGPEGPGLLRLHDPFLDDLARQQVRAHARPAGALEGEAVGRAEGEPVLAKRRRAEHAGPLQAAKALQPLHVEAELLAHEVGKAAQLGGVAEQEHLADRGRAVGAREVVERSLQFRGKLVEHRPHHLEHGLRVFGPHGVALQMLGLGKRELHPLHERLGEAAAADRDAALPDPHPVGDDEVRGIDAHGDEHDRGGRLLGIDRRRIGQLVERHHVGQGDRRELQHVDLDARLRERRERLEHLVALHREQGHFRVEDEATLLHAAREPLPVPHHLFERKGDLLAGLILDDVGDLLGLDRRQLDELREARLAGHRHGHTIALERVAAQEFLQGIAHKLDGVGFRLREQHRVFDVVKRVGHQLPWLVAKTAAHRLQGALADIDSPAERTAGHGLFQKGT